jgi:hypothetical protein
MPVCNATTLLVTYVHALECTTGDNTACVWSATSTAHIVSLQGQQEHSCYAFSQSALCYVTSSQAIRSVTRGYLAASMYAC